MIIGISAQKWLVVPQENLQRRFLFCWWWKGGRPRSHRDRLPSQAIIALNQSHPFLKYELPWQFSVATAKSVVACTEKGFQWFQSRVCTPSAQNNSRNFSGLFLNFPGPKITNSPSADGGWNRGWRGAEEHLLRPLLPLASPWPLLKIKKKKKSGSSHWQV